MNAITNNVEFAAVSFATEAHVDEAVRPFIKGFCQFANKSAENVLEMCKVVADAKAILTDAQFNQFCLAIGLNKDASAISKMKRIGERYNQLMPHKDKLPSAWTTLYRLANMSDDAFEAAIGNCQIHCNMTAKDLSLIAPSKAKAKRGTPSIAVTQPAADAAQFSSFTLKSATVLKTEQVAAVKAKLADIVSEFSLELIAA